METLHAKSYGQLTREELYAILRARQEVFVVEQRCAYRDIDGLDENGLHLYLTDGEGRLAAYLRLLPRADEPGTVHMGRVLTLERGAGLGGRLLKAGIALARERMDAREIYIEAQSYAAPFYAREGFQICSEEFLEDGIPHVQMRLKLTD